MACGSNRGGGRKQEADAPRRRSSALKGRVEFTGAQVMATAAGQEGLAAELATIVEACQDGGQAGWTRATRGVDVSEGLRATAEARSAVRHVTSVPEMTRDEELGLARFLILFHTGREMVEVPDVGREVACRMLDGATFLAEVEGRDGTVVELRDLRGIASEHGCATLFQTIQGMEIFRDAMTGIGDAIDVLGPEEAAELRAVLGIEAPSAAGPSGP